MASKTKKKTTPAAPKKTTKKTTPKKTTKKVAKKKSAAKAKATPLAFTPIPETSLPAPTRMIGTNKQAFEVVYEPRPSKLAKPLKVLEGHTNFVQALAFSPDSKTLVTGSEDGSIRVWDVDKGTCLHTRSEHGTAVNSVAFSSDGARLLSASDDYNVGVWSGAPAYEHLRMMNGHGDYVSRVRAAGPGRAASSSKDGTVRIWNIETGECIHEFDQAGGWVFSLGASNNGKWAVAGSDRNVIKMYNLEKGELERTLLDASDGFIGEVMGMTLAADNTSGIGHRNAPKQIVFSEDDATFLSCDDDLIAWETESGKELARVPGDGWPINGVDFIPNRALAKATESKDATEREFLLRLANEPGNHAARAVYSDWLEEHGRVDEANGVRRYGSARYAFAGTREAVHVIDLVSRAIVAQAAWDHGEVKNIAVSPDGRWAATGSDDGKVGIWDLDVMMEAGLPDRHLSAPNSLAVSRDGIALSGTSDRMIRLWSKDGKSSKRLFLDDGLFNTVAFTPDDRFALVMSDHGVLRAFDTKTGELHGKASFDAESKHVSFNKIEFLRDGRLVVGSISAPMAVWPVDPPNTPFKFDGDGGHVTAMAVDEDADVVVTALYASGTDPLLIRIWKISDGSLVREIALQPTPEQYGTGLILVDDRIAVTTSDGGLLILDRNDGEVIGAWKSATGYLSEVAKLPDGTLLVSSDQPFIVDVRKGEVVKRIAWEDGRGGQLVAIEGSMQAILRENNGISLVDFAADTLSAMTPLSEIGETVASHDGRYAVTASRNADLVGGTVVLKRV